MQGCVVGIRRAGAAVACVIFNIVILFHHYNGTYLYF